MRVFNEIGLQNIRGDIFGGVTAAVIALPMALAFGVASGAGAEAGLYGAILVGLFAALFGGSPTLISEPTGPMTVIFTAVIAKLIASDPANGMAMAFTVVIMAGMFQILFGALRLGKYVTLMPYGVVSGFMSGIGIILIILQIGPLLGQPSPTGGVLAILEEVPALLSGIRPEETALALITVAILFLMPLRFKRYIPPQLLALIIGTLVSIMLLHSAEIRRIGEIPTGMPAFQMPVFSIEQWQIMLIDAIVLGMLGCIDALLTSVIADSLTRKQHNSDKELIGQGIGNVMSGLFGGLPGAGATMGTVVSIQSGARTALSGIVRAGILIVVVMWAADLTAAIPLAVLAGIALKVGIDIIDWGFLKRAHRLSGKGALVTYGVIALTVFVDLIAAVGIGLFVANVMTITRLSELQAHDVKAVTDPDETDLPLTPYEHDLLETAAGKVLLLHLQGNMIFGVSRAISRKNSMVEGREALVIDLRDVVHLGLSSALALEETMLDMIRAGRGVYLVGVEGQPRERLEKLGILEQIPVENITAKRTVALEKAIYGGASNQDGSTHPDEHKAEPPTGSDQPDDGPSIMAFITKTFNCTLRLPEDTTMTSNPTQASLLNLPSIAEVKKLVEDSLTHDWILRVEHIGPAAGDAKRAQWQQWGDSLFAVTDASSVVDGIVSCRYSNPQHAIRLNAEKVKPRTQMYFPVYRPEPQGSEARIINRAAAVSSLINEYVSSLANGAKTVRAMAWKIATVVGMLLASLLMLEEVVA